MRNTFFLIAAAALCLGGCTQAEPGSEDRFERLFSGSLTVLDLTHALNTTSPYWPNASGNPFTYDTLAAQESGAPAMGAYSTPEHHGTTSTPPSIPPITNPRWTS